LPLHRLGLAASSKALGIPRCESGHPGSALKGQQLTLDHLTRVLQGDIQAMLINGFSAELGVQARRLSLALPDGRTKPSEPGQCLTGGPPT
jgi:hypothetical protein